MSKEKDIENIVKEAAEVLKKKIGAENEYLIAAGNEELVGVEASCSNVFLSAVICDMVKKLDKEIKMLVMLKIMSMDSDEKDEGIDE